MTNKEFYEQVIKANLSKEITDKAEHLLNLANGRTDKRAEKATANQNANLALFKDIAKVLHTNTTYAVSEVKTVLAETVYSEITTSKLTAIFKLAVDNGLATAISGYKVGGKGRAVKGYIICENESENENTTSYESSYESLKNSVYEEICDENESEE